MACNNVINAVAQKCLENVRMQNCVSTNTLAKQLFIYTLIARNLLVQAKAINARNCAIFRGIMIGNPSNNSILFVNEQIILLLIC